VFVRGERAATRRIRVVAGNLLWTPAVRVAQAVQEGVAAAGFEVSVFDGRGDLSAVVAELRALPGSGATGAVVMSQHDPAFNHALAALVAADFPFVVADQTLSDLPGSSVASDNRAGGRLAAEALLAAGHRRLAFLGDLAADTTAERAQGAADACAAALVPPPLRLNIPGQRFADWEPAIRKRIDEMLRARPRPTAIVCSCDAVARHAIRALAKCGVAVPRAMSVTGFDDDPIAEWGSPALTTVRQDFAEMGRRALALLAERLVAGSAPRHEAVPVSLVRRESVVPPPRHRVAACRRA
jgi:DNA-binding LacI/PurR family transcriptional regulator